MAGIDWAFRIRHEPLTSVEWVQVGAPCLSCRTRGAPTRCRDGIIQSGFGLLSASRNVRTVGLRESGAIAATRTGARGIATGTVSGFAPRARGDSGHPRVFDVGFVAGCRVFSQNADGAAESVAGPNPGGCWGLLLLCGDAPPGGSSGLAEVAIASTTTFQVDQRHPTFGIRWVPLIAFGVSTRYVTVAE